MKNRNLTVLLGITLCTLFILMGCGLNTRSAAENDPIPVQVNTDVNNENNDVEGGQDDGAQAGEQPADGSGDTGGETGDGSANPEQPAAGADQGDGYVAPEAPREEQPADGSGESGGGEGDNSAGQGEGGEQVAPDPTPVPPTPVPATVTPAEQNNSQATSHVVTRGETLYSIAQRYGLTVQELAAANGIINVNDIDAGQELVIPVAGTVVVPTEGTVHIVSAGDTLFRIGLRYGFTVEELATYNNITNINSLEIGQEIKIPPQ